MHGITKDPLKIGPGCATPGFPRFQGSPDFSVRVYCSTSSMFSQWISPVVPSGSLKQFFCPSGNKEPNHKWKCSLLVMRTLGIVQANKGFTCLPFSRRAIFVQRRGEGGHPALSSIKATESDPNTKPGRPSLVGIVAAARSCLLSMVFFSTWDKNKNLLSYHSHVSRPPKQLYNSIDTFNFALDLTARLTFSSHT